jgi:hypothetical protein
MSTHVLWLPRLPTAFALHWQRCVDAWRQRRAEARHQRPDHAALRDLALDASEWPWGRAAGAGRTELTRRRIEPLA